MIFDFRCRQPRGARTYQHMLGGFDLLCPTLIHRDRTGRVVPSVADRQRPDVEKENWRAAHWRTGVRDPLPP